MTTRILHAATHGHNIGDGALVAGMHATLREDLDRELEFIPFDVLDLKLTRQRNMLTRRDYRALEADIDLVLVGGGGMIEGNLGSYLSGINFNFSLSLLKQTRRPWVFYALGFNQFPGTRFFHGWRLRRLIEIARDRGMPFTVRNDRSAKRLRRLLPRIGPIETIPDPGLWVPEGSVMPLGLDPDRPNVLVQLAGDRLDDRVRSARKTMNEIAGSLEQVVTERDVNLVFAPHLLTDVKLFAVLSEALPDHVVRRSCTMGPVLRGAASAPDYFELYRHVNLVVGMRGHSLICAVGCGTPVIGLGSHAKIQGFLDEIQLTESLIDITRTGFRDRLARMIVAHLRREHIKRRRVAKIRDSLREQTRAFHARIEGLL